MRPCPYCRKLFVTYGRSNQMGLLGERLDWHLITCPVRSMIREQQRRRELGLAR